MTANRTGRRWAWTRLALRAAAGIQALLVLAQAMLAGQFLIGNSGAREFHRELGTEVITWIAFVALALAVLAWRPGHYPAWPIVAMALGVVAVILQLGYGFEGRLDIHIPLGVAICALYFTVLVGFKSDGSGQGDQA